MLAPRGENIIAIPMMRVIHRLCGFEKTEYGIGGIATVSCGGGSLEAVALVSSLVWFVIASTGNEVHIVERRVSFFVLCCSRQVQPGIMRWQFKYGARHASRVKVPCRETSYILQRRPFCSSFYNGSTVTYVYIKHRMFAASNDVEMYNCCFYFIRKNPGPGTSW